MGWPSVRCHSMRSPSTRVALVFALLATLLAGSTPAWSVTKGDVDRACAASIQALRDLEAAQADLERATIELNDVYSRVEDVTAKEVTLRATVEAHEREITSTQDGVVERAVDMYMRGGTDLQTLFFSAQSVNEMLTAQELVVSAANSDIGVIDRLNALTTDTERLRGQVLEARAELRELQASMEERAATLESARDRATESQRRLSGECARVKDAYDRELARRRAAEAAARAGASGGLPAEATPGFICPVAGPVSFINDWGFPRSGGRTHKGTDMFARRGTPLVAVAAGTVTTGNGGLGGITVNLRSDYGVRFYYAHLDGWGPGISGGVRVTKGQVLGYVGDTGNARGTSPHLHFGITTTQQVNPFPTVRRSC
jgi:peptidoglycan LD-endopeptidase LytH